MITKIHFIKAFKVYVKSIGFVKVYDFKFRIKTSYGEKQLILVFNTLGGLLTVMPLFGVRHDIVEDIHNEFRNIDEESKVFTDTSSVGLEFFEYSGGELPETMYFNIRELGIEGTIEKIHEYYKTAEFEYFEYYSDLENLAKDYVKNKNSYIYNRVAPSVRIQRAAILAKLVYPNEFEQIAQNLLDEIASNHRDNLIKLIEYLRNYNLPIVS